jgi:hypothetical protein
MCIYRIKSNGRYFCGKRVPLACSREVCPFGEKWEYLVKKDERQGKYFWVCRKTGKIEKTEDLEEAFKKVKEGEGDYICKSMSFRFMSGRVRPVAKGVKKYGTFDDALKATRFIDLQIEGVKGEGAKIAIIDTGVSPDAPSSFKISMHDMSVVDREEHGSYIHEIIFRLAPEAEIGVIQLIGEDVPDYLLISALEKCIELGVHAINMSIQSEYWSDGEDPLSLYVNYLAQEKKIATCIAAGNGGPAFCTIGSPGAARNAITVGATDAYGRIWKYSSRGPTLDGRFKPDLVAPGVFIFEESLLEGTSFATPWATSIAAIMNSMLKSPVAVRRLLHLSAKPIPIVYEADKKLVYKKRSVKRPRVLERLVKLFGEAWPLVYDSRNIAGAGLLDAKNAYDLTLELFNNISEIKTGDEAERP